MMMMADGNILSNFGTIPTNTTPFKGPIRQPSITPRTTLEAPNAFTGKPDGQITQAEIPTAFRGGVMGSGNTLLAAQQFQAMSTPRQSIFSNSPITASNSNFNTTSEFLNATQGSNNVARKNALNSGGASGLVVTKTGPSYTGT